MPALSLLGTVLTLRPLSLISAITQSLLETRPDSFRPGDDTAPRSSLGEGLIEYFEDHMAS